MFNLDILPIRTARTLCKLFGDSVDNILAYHVSCQLNFWLYENRLFKIFYRKYLHLIHVWKFSIINSNFIVISTS